MNLSIIVYAAALYMLGGHRSDEIRKIAHGLALCWVSTLLIWLASKGELSPAALIPVRTAFAVLIICWVQTPLARLVGAAVVPIIGAYLLVYSFPDQFGSGTINLAVFAQLIILGWGAWGDGLARLVNHRDRSRLRGNHHSSGFSRSGRKGEGLDQ